MAYKFRLGARKSKQTENADAFSGDETRAPCDQNAVELTPIWISAFPAELNIRAGELQLFSDARIAWAIQRFGDLKGRRVLELGPLEGAHTCMLSRAGAEVEAVEGNRRAYLKCLISKEILGFDKAKFLLGDFLLWLEENDKTYDLIVACGVLYHMLQPLRLLEAIAKRTDCAYLWTVAVNDEREPTEHELFSGRTIRLYNVPYGERDSKYCGGLASSANWIHRDDLLTVLNILGFVDTEIAHEDLVAEHQNLISLSIFAKRPRS